MLALTPVSHAGSVRVYSVCCCPLLAVLLGCREHVPLASVVLQGSSWHRSVCMLKGPAVKPQVLSYHAVAEPCLRCCNGWCALQASVASTVTFLLAAFEQPSIIDHTPVPLHTCLGTAFDP